MKFYSSKTIRQKIQSLSLFLVLTTAVLGMTTTLAFSLRMEYDNLDRNLMNSALVLAQSPDVADVLAGRSDGEVLTDDCAAVERLGMKVSLSRGSRENLKLTTPFDLIVGEAILDARERGELG